MPLSIVVFDDSAPEDPRPLLATHDPAVIAIVRKALLERLEGQPSAFRDKIRLLAEGKPEVPA